MIDLLYSFDQEYRNSRGSIICGVDEAGRGPLAGPVCCAAVILDSKTRIEKLNDSKKLSEKVREQLYEIIVSQCIAYSVIMVDSKEIDSINILQATLKGMSEAIEQLDQKPDLALIDGNKIPDTKIRCINIIGGDAKSASIAAASVLAKVTRDRYMIKMDALYPGYGFARHKGYGTAAHYQAIKNLGKTPIHRYSFTLDH